MSSAFGSVSHECVHGHYIGLNCDVSGPPAVHGGNCDGIGHNCKRRRSVSSCIHLLVSLVSCAESHFPDTQGDNATDIASRLCESSLAAESATRHNLSSRFFCPSTPFDRLWGKIPRNLRRGANIKHLCSKFCCTAIAPFRLAVSPSRLSSPCQYKVFAW